MVKVAILDRYDGYIGTREVKKPGPRDIVVCDEIDLPKDGTYRYCGERQCFVPMGFGRGMIPARGPVPETMVLYQLVQTIRQDPEIGDRLPQEARDWADWWEQHLRQSQEQAVRTQKRGKVK